MGPVLADGGTLFVVSDVPEGVAVEWSHTGGGSLTAITTWTDGNGLAAAKYLAAGGTPAVPDEVITVTARVYHHA